MGPVNWIAVILAANFAVAVGVVWYGPLFGGGRPLIEPAHNRQPRAWGLVIGAMLLFSANSNTGASAGFTLR